MEYEKTLKIGMEQDDTNTKRKLIPLLEILFSGYCGIMLSLSLNPILFDLIFNWKNHSSIFIIYTTCFAIIIYSTISFLLCNKVMKIAKEQEDTGKEEWLTTLLMKILAISCGEMIQIPQINWMFFILMVHKGFLSKFVVITIIMTFRKPVRNILLTTFKNQKYTTIKSQRLAMLLKTLVISCCETTLSVLESKKYFIFSLIRYWDDLKDFLKYFSAHNMLITCVVAYLVYSEINVLCKTVLKITNEQENTYVKQRLPVSLKMNNVSSLENNLILVGLVLLRPFKIFEDLIGYLGYYSAAFITFIALIIFGILLNCLKTCSRQIKALKIWIKNTPFQVVIEHFEKALKTAQKRESEAYLWLGYVYELNNRFKLAIENYSKALKVAKERQDKQQETDAYFGLGSAYTLNNNFEKAIECYEKALKNAKEREDKEKEREAYLGLGDAHKLNNRIQLAIEYFNKALKIAKVQEDKAQETGAYLRLGYAYKSNNENQAAIRCYEKALKIARKQGDKEQETEACLRIEGMETKKKGEKVIENKEKTWFEEYFLDSEFELKEEIHEKLRSFPWLRGAYGLTRPNKNVPRLHIFLTVKRGVTKSVVQEELEKMFVDCDVRKYFELLQESANKKTKVKYMGHVLRKLCTGSNVKPALGGGVIACNKYISNDSKPVAEEVQGRGTLTIFCSQNGHHYALTCFHVGCATDKNKFNATFNELENIQEIHDSLGEYVKCAKERQYYFEEGTSGSVRNNEPISFGSDKRKLTLLGEFDKFHFDKKCDILSVKINDDIDIDCKVADITSPDWKRIWYELHQRVRTSQNSVEVEKFGYSSAITRGHIAHINIDCVGENGDVLFEKATVVKAWNCPFLEGGDSGSLVFFNDLEDQKQVFAYGVCEVDHLVLPEQEESMNLYDDDDDNNNNNNDNGDANSGGSDDVIFEDNSTGPYFICLRLDTALGKLKLQEAACFNDCGSD